MKKITSLLVASLFTFASYSYAATPGAYVGLGLGVSKILSADENLLNGTNIQNSRSLGGLGGRVFAGYNFSRYLGLEAGLAHYAPSKYNATDFNTNQSYALKYDMNALDLVGKGYLPIGESGFNAYALGGVAYVKSKEKVSVSPDTGNEAFSHSANKIRPIYGLGVSYDVSEKVTTNVEFTQIKGTGSHGEMPSANMVTFNVAYNIGD